MIKKVVASLAFLLVLTGGAFGQDPEFSQYASVPMNLNPALAGVAYGPRFNVVYRNEWPKIDKGFVTYGLSYDQHFDKFNSSVGMLFLYDQVAGGLLNSYHLRLNYAYRFQFANKIGLQIGLYGGYVGRTVNWGQLTFNDQINPLFGFENPLGVPNLTSEPLPQSENIHLFDAGAGFLLYSKMAYGGFSFSHISFPKEGFTDNTEEFRLPVKATIHGGVVIDVTPKKRNSNNWVSPNVAFHSQAGSIQIVPGTYVNWSKIFAGAFYRHNFSNTDAVIGVMGVQIQFVRIAYSYDYTLSRLQTRSGGAHEVTFSINLGGENGPMNPDNRTRRLECPGVLSF